MGVCFTKHIPIFLFVCFFSYICKCKNTIIIY